MKSPRSWRFYANYTTIYFVDLALSIMYDGFTQRCEARWGFVRSSEHIEPPGSDTELCSHSAAAILGLFAVLK